MTELAPWLVVLFAFGAVACVVFVGGQYLTGQLELHRRSGSSEGQTENRALSGGAQQYRRHLF